MKANPGASTQINGWYTNAEYLQKWNEADQLYASSLKLNKEKNTLSSEVSQHRQRRAVIDPGNEMKSSTFDQDGQGLLSTNNPVAEKQGLTTFQDSASTMAEKLHYTSTLSQKLQSCDNVQTDIRQVITRPTLLPPITWDSTQAVATIIGYYTVPGDILAYTNKLFKIAGYQYWKADCVFRIHLVSQTFQAGRLLVCYDPYRAQKGANIANSTSQFQTLSSIILDPAQPNPVEFRIPYVSLLGMWNINRQSAAGQLLFVVLNQLSSAATTESTTVQVSAWFENVCVSCPNASALYVAQGNAEDEIERIKEDKISSKLTRVKEVAGTLMHVPLISSIASPVYWASKAAASIAAAFGFAKPMNTAAATRVISQPFASITNFDNVSNCLSLTHSSKYTIEQTDNFASDIDEMDISFIASNMTVVTALEWKVADAATSLLGSIRFPRFGSQKICSWFSFL